MGGGALVVQTVPALCGYGGVGRLRLWGNRLTTTLLPDRKVALSACQRSPCAGPRESSPSLLNFEYFLEKMFYTFLSVCNEAQKCVHIGR